jgi:hypothetical protein
MLHRIRSAFDHSVRSQTFASQCAPPQSTFAAAFLRMRSVSAVARSKHCTAQWTTGSTTTALAVRCAQRKTAVWSKCTGAAQAQPPTVLRGIRWKHCCSTWPTVSAVEWLRLLPQLLWTAAHIVDEAARRDLDAVNARRPAGPHHCIRERAAAAPLKPFACSECARSAA